MEKQKRACEVKPAASSLFPMRVKGLFDIVDEKADLSDQYTFTSTTELVPQSVVKPQCYKL